MTSDGESVGGCKLSRPDSTAINPKRRLICNGSGFSGVCDLAIEDSPCTGNSTCQRGCSLMKNDSISHY